MKILINGFTAKELVFSYADKSREEQAELVLTHLKRNKKVYKRLVVCVAVLIMQQHVPIYATETLAQSVAGQIEPLAQELIELFVLVGKYACIGKTVADSLALFLEGKTMKEIFKNSTSTVILFIWLQFIPTLLDSFTGIGR